MEERQKASLIRVGIPIFIMITITGFMYIQFYRPMLQNILTFRENLNKGEQELSGLEKSSKGIKGLTKEEQVAWKVAQEKIYERLPPAETLPKRITFKGSANLFYGAGDPFLGQVPQLFLELLQLVFANGQKQLSLTSTHNKNALTIPAPGEGLNPLKLDKSTLKFPVEMSFQKLADFLAQLQELPRFIKVTKITMRPGGGVLQSTITVATYHCRKGALGNVSEQ